MLQILAIVLGATFFNLPPTANGGFTRGSIMFVGRLSIDVMCCGQHSHLISHAC